MSLRRVSGQSQVSLMSVSGQFQASLRSISGQSQVSLRSVSGQSQVSLRSFSDLSVPSEPKILRLVYSMIHKTSINKTKYFRLRLTDEVSSERPKGDL